MTDYDSIINKNKRKKNNNNIKFDEMAIPLSEMTEEQKAKMKVKHYTIHIPATATKQQLAFIQSVAIAVMSNKPLTIIHEEGMKRLLRWAYQYRNVLSEYDEQKRWTDMDEADLNKISTEFKPILDFLKEQYKLNIEPFRRD